jgi:hypothetical protein
VRAGLERTHLYRKLKQLGVELARGGRRAGAHVAAEPAPRATTELRNLHDLRGPGDVPDAA